MLFDTVPLQFFFHSLTFTWTTAKRLVVLCCNKILANIVKQWVYLQVFLLSQIWTNNTIWLSHFLPIQSFNGLQWFLAHVFTLQNMKNQFFHSHLNESILGETYNIAMITRLKKNKCNANITGLAKQIACTAKCANTPKEHIQYYQWDMTHKINIL